MYLYSVVFLALIVLVLFMQCEINFKTWGCCSNCSNMSDMFECSFEHVSTTAII